MWKLPFMSLFSLLVSAFFPINSFGSPNKALIAYATQNKAMPKAQFYTNFPYEKFAQQQVLKNLRQLNDAFGPLQELGRNPTELLSTIFTTYLDKSQNEGFSFDDLVAELQLGERYLNCNYLIADTSFVFRDFGDGVLEQVGVKLKTALKKKTIKKKSFEFNYLKRRLLENHYRVDVPMSKIDKGLMHLKNGNVGYVIKRVWGDYKGWIIGLIICFALLVYLFFKRRRRSTS